MVPTGFWVLTVALLVISNKGKDTNNTHGVTVYILMLAKTFGAHGLPTCPWAPPLCAALSGRLRPLRDYSAS